MRTSRNFWSFWSFSPLTTHAPNIPEHFQQVHKLWDDVEKINILPIAIGTM